MEFKNLDSLFKYIEKNVKFALQDVGNEVEKIIHDYIMENLYSKNKDTDYARTYNFVNSLSVRKVTPSDDGYVVELYFDIARIIPNETPKGEWNQHMNVWGDIINEAIPMWIEEGTTKGLRPRKELKSMETTRKQLEEDGRHVKKIKEILESKGFIVEFNQ